MATEQPVKRCFGVYTKERKTEEVWKGHGSIASLTGLERLERGGGHGNGKKAPIGNGLER